MTIDETELARALNDLSMTSTPYSDAVDIFVYVYQLREREPGDLPAMP